MCAGKKPSILSSGPKAISVFPNCCAGGRKGARLTDTEFRDREQIPDLPRRRARKSVRAAWRPSSPCRRAATNSALSASCPIRAGPRCRAQVAKIVAEVAALAEAGVREMTLIGQNVNAYRGADLPGRSGRWSGCSNISPPSRGWSGCATPRVTRSTWRRADRRACRVAQADALRASAGAIGLRPRAQGDEPQPRRARLSRHRRGGCARRGPTSRSPPISSSAFPARPKPISRRRWRSFARSISPRPSRSNIRRAPARPAPNAMIRSTPRSCASGWRTCRRWSRRNDRPSTPRPLGESRCAV